MSWMIVVMWWSQFLATEVSRGLVRVFSLIEVASGLELNEASHQAAGESSLWVQVRLHCYLLGACSAHEAGTWKRQVEVGTRCFVCSASWAPCGKQERQLPHQQLRSSGARFGNDQLQL